MAPDPDDEIQPGVTVADLEAQYEGEPFQSIKDQDYFECDWCSGGVPYKSQPRVGHYLADDVVGDWHPRADEIHTHRPFMNLMTYCEECAQKLLLFPAEGFAEVRMFFDLDEDRVMKNIEITDISPRDDGIPWDPREVSEEITGLDHDKRVSNAADGTPRGPESVVTGFLSTVEEIDIRELVQWDGTLDPKLLGQARRKYEEFRKEMAAQGNSRRAFRDSVRGK